MNELERPMRTNPWHRISAALRKPWPVEAAEVDLYLEVEFHRATGIPRPSNRALQQRWGWKGGNGRRRVAELAAVVEAVPPLPLRLVQP